MDLTGKRVMVVGLGVSGLAVARFLAAARREARADDRNDNLERGKLPAGEIHLGAEDPAWLKGVDLVVTSPGVPRNSILLRGGRRRFP